MKPFEHYTVKNVKEAVSLLSKYGERAKVNAGGTDLIGVLKHRILPTYPEAIVNIKTIEDLNYIRKEKRGIRIGALTKLADLVESPDIKGNYRLLSEAAKSVATPNTRSMATIGGNLAQDVRCWYYRYPREIGGPILCLRKGGSLCNALLGDNHYHSIFGAAPLDHYPCIEACPGHIHIPLIMNEVKKGKLKEATLTLLDFNPMPAITGRVCPAFCETKCLRGTLYDAVAIGCVERALGDYALEKPDEFYKDPGIGNGKRIAIIGSGPAGLAAAFYLRRCGYNVRVYERFEEAGGMLVFSVPPYHLSKDVVKKQVEAFKGMGIEFKLGIEIGKDVLSEDLEKDFDVCLFAGGTWVPLRMALKGQTSEGVLYGLDYLRMVRSEKKISLGDRVVVVGGGGVAFDVARVAKRTGPRDVHIICLESRDLTSKDRIIAFDQEILDAEEEGIIIHPSLGVKEIITREGRVIAISTVKCVSVREPDGRFNPTFDDGSPGPTIEADSIVIAIGQTHDSSLISLMEQISKPSFLAGDMATGPSTVIKAIASGREKAMEIIKCLGDKRGLEPVRKTGFVETAFSPNKTLRIRKLPVEDRLESLTSEEIRRVEPSEAEEEAKRCLVCGCLAVSPSDIAVALVALYAIIVTTKRKLKAQEFFKASASRSTIINEDELIKEVFIPKAGEGVKQKFLKFTLREPIDFSVVSAACLLNMKDEICEGARLVLGGVAPEPIRCEKAESTLTGRHLTEQVAEEVALVALDSVLLLSQNGYKVQTAKTILKRAILSAE